jgi:hypothetical protein
VPNWSSRRKGKVAAKQNVRKLLEQYFAAVTDRLEAEIRSKGGAVHH